MASEAKDLAWLRRQIVTALATDEELFDLLVFKGGNALALAHEIGMRASLDLDYSMEKEVESEQRLGERMKAALESHLSRHGLTLFDWSFVPRPKIPKAGRRLVLGGYLGEFKVIETSFRDELLRDIEQARKAAWSTSVDGQSPRKFRIELSRSEYCQGATRREVGDGFEVRVYTPAMIAAEKLRALCQQRPEYQHAGMKRKARGRDFYDIHAIVTEAGVNLLSTENVSLIRAVFAAKEVPLALLARVQATSHSTSRSGTTSGTRSRLTGRETSLSTRVSFCVCCGG